LSSRRSWKITKSPLCVDCYTIRMVTVSITAQDLYGEFASSNGSDSADVPWWEARAERLRKRRNELSHTNQQPQDVR
jgi:hypothetical protein